MIRKYPRTRHLVGSQLQPGDDDLERVPFNQIAGRHIVVEEKMDGANCAFSFSSDGELRLQSRGHLLTGGPRERHFDLFKQWTRAHEERFFDAVGDQFVVYGEWLHAKHTVYYDALPHYFMEFDVLDRARDEFLDTPRRRHLLAGVPLEPVKVLFDGIAHDEASMWSLIGRSSFITDRASENLRSTCQRLKLHADQIARETDLSRVMEGLYIKVEEDGVVKDRLKIVRRDFVTRVSDSERHWLDRPMVPNHLSANVDLFAERAS